MSRIVIHFREEPESDRWIWGDRWLRPLARRLIRGKRRPGGLDKVFMNLRLGLERLGVPHDVNVPFSALRPGDLLGVIGRGRSCLEGYTRKERFVAGIGLMTHPSEWPTLFDDYPVATYLQHSEWCADIYRRAYGGRCKIWAVGIDTETWRPTRRSGGKPVDFLIYDKIPWQREKFGKELIDPVTASLDALGLTHIGLRYGEYRPEAYKEALANCSAAIFLSPHESQGIACEEAMASGVPVLAWDPGFCQDPERFRWNDPVIKTTSVPYFDERCGLRFAGVEDFVGQLEIFVDSLAAGKFQPRDYILENLTVERCAQNFVTILRESLP